MKDYQTLRE